MDDALRKRADEAVEALIIRVSAGRPPKTIRNGAVVEFYRLVKSLSRTAAHFGISRQRVSQIINANRNAQTD